MGTILDALTELGDLSLDLQKRNMTLLEADKLIRRTIRILESMSHNPGPYTKYARDSIRKTEFKSVPLINNKCVTKIKT